MSSVYPSFCCGSHPGELAAIRAAAKPTRHPTMLRCQPMADARGVGLGALGRPISRESCDTVISVVAGVASLRPQPHGNVAADPLRPTCRDSCAFTRRLPTQAYRKRAFPRCNRCVSHAGRRGCVHRRSGGVWLSLLRIQSPRVRERPRGRAHFERHGLRTGLGIFAGHRERVAEDRFEDEPV